MRERSGLPDHTNPDHTNPGRTRRRVPSRILIPFLLFWSLGAFALGGEVSRLPLVRVAAAIVRPAHAAASVQGQLAQVASDRRVHLVATGVLGNKPTAAAKHVRGKTVRTKARSSGRGALQPQPGLCGSAPGDASAYWSAGGYTSGWSGSEWYPSGPWQLGLPWRAWSPQSAWGAPRNWDVSPDTNWDD